MTSRINCHILKPQERSIRSRKFLEKQKKSKRSSAKRRSSPTPHRCTPIGINYIADDIDFDQIQPETDTPTLDSNGLAPFKAYHQLKLPQIGQYLDIAA